MHYKRITVSSGELYRFPIPLFPSADSPFQWHPQSLQMFATLGAVFASLALIYKWPVAKCAKFCSASGGWNINPDTAAFVRQPIICGILFLDLQAAVKFHISLLSCKITTWAISWYVDTNREINYLVIYCHSSAIWGERNKNPAFQGIQID